MNRALLMTALHINFYGSNVKNSCSYSSSCHAFPNARGVFIKFRMILFCFHSWQSKIKMYSRSKKKKKKKNCIEGNFSGSYMLFQTSNNITSKQISLIYLFIIFASKMDCDFSRTSSLY